MKIANSLITSWLALIVAARPHPTDNGDILEQKSRITAFVIDEEGSASVECWEINQLAEEFQIKRADGSKGTAQSVSIASSDEIERFDILTWPAYSPIWPGPPDAVTAQYLDLSNTFNLFNIQGGLISFKLGLGKGVGAAASEENHIFSLENGDDWFYFEDQYTGSDADIARSKAGNAPPVSIGTVSATETESMRLRYGRRPSHKVIHKGACSFTGIETSAGSSAQEAKTSHHHNPFTVQVQIEESL